MKYRTWKEFYPFYLTEHRNQTCKILHFIGTTLVIASAAWMTMNDAWRFWWTIPLFGYGFAWAGHFGFEKNRPASFKQPFFSLISDFAMFWHLLSGQLSFSTGARLKQAA